MVKVYAAISGTCKFLVVKPNYEVVRFVKHSSAGTELTIKQAAELVEKHPYMSLEFHYVNKKAKVLPKNVAEERIVISANNNSKK